MRRLIAVAAGLAAALALPGCSRPAGVDGNLVDDWPALPSARTPVPAAGACYTQRYTQTWYGDFDPVDCATRTHQTETALVGTFTGTQAGRPTPPNRDDSANQDDSALRGVYSQCQQGASDYLGGDWHGAIVGLGLVLPSAGAWTGGARWFRCDLLHYSDPDATSVIDQGTLRGDLAGPRTAAYGCLAVTTDSGRRHILTSKPIGCEQPHGAEFAGLYTAPDVPWPSDDTRRENMLTQGCEGVVAHFLGYSATSQWHNDKVGWWELPWDETQWALGDRTTQCFAFAYTSSGTFAGSVKGIRDQAPKG